MWTEIKGAYRMSARVAVAAPLIFALPLVAELIQHAIEYRVGMYESFAAMQAAEGNAARLGFGQVKILSLMLITYWVVRQLARFDGAELRLLGDRRSLVLFSGVIALSILTALLQQFGGGLISPFVPNPRAVFGIGVAFFFLLTALEIYLMGWKVGAALGNPRLTIPASFRLMHGHFWWSLGYFVAMFLPLMVLHYALNILAIGRGDGLLWTILIADSFVVGYLGIVLVATNYAIVRRAAARKGVTLAP